MKPPVLNERCVWENITMSTFLDKVCITSLHPGWDLRVIWVILAASLLGFCKGSFFEKYSLGVQGLGVICVSAENLNSLEDSHPGPGPVCA